MRLRLAGATSLLRSSGTFEISENAVEVLLVAVVIFPLPEIADIALIA
jgi:hypothetical protein